MEKRVWRIRVERPYQTDRIIGEFPNFEAADKERRKLQRKPEFKKFKLVVFPDPPMGHKILDIG
jgi:hypothetical protein